MPNTVFKEIYPYLVEHAKEVAPLECCALIVNFKGKLKYVKCTNIYHGLNNFIIKPEDYANAEDLGDIVAVAHSHVSQPARFSKVDLACLNKGNVPWVLYSILDDGILEKYPEHKIEDYLNREYVYAVQDCYSIVQDYYIQELEIDLGPPPKQDPLDPTKGAGLYKVYEEYGFYEIPMKDLQKGDCILMCNNSTEPNHAAIYLGDNVVLHHPAGRLSHRSIYGGYWMKNTWKCIRHKDRK